MKLEIYNQYLLKYKLYYLKLLIVSIFIFIFTVHISYSQNNKSNELPNILLIIADDMTWRDSEPYGNPDIKTPNIQSLSDEGMTFNNMFTTTAMCAPFRMELYTGLYPVRNGGYPNSSNIYEGGKSVVHHFKNIGYRVALAGKRHIGPDESFPFEYHDEYLVDESIPQELKEFMEGGKTDPFFLVVAHNSPHLPWDRGDQSQYNADELLIPEYMIDTPFTREMLVNYYAEITFFDYSLGKYVDYLKENGVDDNTIVIFSSEQGSAFPFAKWTTYDLGLKNGFIMRWPDVIEAGSENDALIQTVDLLPTLLDASGVNPDTVNTGIPAANKTKGFDGRSFLNVIKGNTKVHRKYVYGVQTTRGIGHGSEAYPIRSVRDENYKYIMNLNHEETFTNNQTEVDGARGEETFIGARGFVYQDWLRNTENNPELYERVKSYQLRPSEEFYEINKDPFELHNLADKSEYVVIKNQMKEVLLQWMKSQGDSGMGTEMRALYR